MTERVNHERVFKFLCMCERRRIQRVIQMNKKDATTKSKIYQKTNAMKTEAS